MVRECDAGTVGCFLLGRAEKEGRPLLAAEASPGGELIKQVVPDKLLKKLVAIELADEAASVIVVGDVGRILGKKIAHDLIDRIIALFREGAIDLREDLLHLRTVVDRHAEFDRVMIQLRPPPFFLSSIISEIRDKVKEKCVNKLETKRCSAELGVQLFF
jgi:hypothetical protein